MGVPFNNNRLRGRGSTRIPWLGDVVSVGFMSSWVKAEGRAERVGPI